MSSRTWNRKSIAFCLAVACLSLYSMAALATSGTAGRLSVFGRVTVNGQGAECGTTVLSDSTINTRADSAATVSLGSLGVVELSPNSTLRLSFGESTVTGVLEAGEVKISTPAGISTNITTKDGAIVTESSRENSFAGELGCGTSFVSSYIGNAELRTASATKVIAAGSQDSAGQAAPGTRCTSVRTRDVKRLFPRCTRGR
jgi:hypothetical protein